MYIAVGLFFLISIARLGARFTGFAEGPKCVSTWMFICGPTLVAWKETSPYLGTVGARDKKAIDVISILYQALDSVASDANHD